MREPTKPRYGAGAKRIHRARRWAALPLAAGAGLSGVLLVCLLLATRPAQAAGVVTPPCNEAALEAALAGGGLVTFNCGPDPVTITLSSQKVITQDTVVDGGGLIGLSGAGATRVFSVATGARLDLMNITLREGSALGAEDQGGAIFSAGGLAITDVTFIDNIAWYGGAVHVSDGIATIRSSRFLSNTGYFGGALALQGAQLVTIQDSELAGNEAGSEGGAIFAADSGGLRISGSTLSDNEALIGSGGAIYTEIPLTLTTSSLHRNVSEADGGAVLSANAAWLEAVDIYGNSSINQSGGGLANTGTAELNNVTLHGNTARLGGGLANFLPITITNSSIYENFAGERGGGIYNRGRAILQGVNVFSNTIYAGEEAGGAGLFVQGDEAEVLLQQAVVAANRVSDISVDDTGSGGGGLSVLSGTVVVLDSSIYNNVVEDGAGGGIYAGPGAVLSVVRSAIFYNQAEEAGGGIEAQDLGEAGSLTIADSTLSGNVAAQGGGLNAAAGDGIAVINTTVYSNSADSGGNFHGTASVENTLIAAGTPNNCAMVLITLGHNLEDADTCGLGAPGDLVDVDPQVGPLADNGGPTPTHALMAGSPAIDAASNSTCPPTDQRGLPRPVDGNEDGMAVCDIGAFEYQGAAPEPPAEADRIYLPVILR